MLEPKIYQRTAATILVCVFAISASAEGMSPVPYGSLQTANSGGANPNTSECRAVLGCDMAASHYNYGKQCPTAGNPINFATGNKIEELKITLNAEIDFILFYNSYVLLPPLQSVPRWPITRHILGKGWFSNFELHTNPISMTGYAGNWEMTIGLTRPDGRVVYFRKQSYSQWPQADEFVGEWELMDPEQAEKGRLIRSANDWEYYSEDGKKEIYRLVNYFPGSDDPPVAEPKQGVISRVIDLKTGRMTHHFGLGQSTWPSWVGDRTSDSPALAQFTLYPEETGINAGKLKSIVDNNNPSRVWQFVHDDQERLKQIIYPDGTTTVFHYYEEDDPSVPGTLKDLLTGITDRRGIRYATFGYDAHGFAYRSELAEGVNKVEVSGIGGNNSNTFNRYVKDSRGQWRTYLFEKRFGAYKMLETSGSGCSSCTNQRSSYQYDDHNNIISKTVNGVTTAYTINNAVLGQYSAMTTAPGTPQEHTRYLTYHPVMPTKVVQIAEDSVAVGRQKVTNFSYNSDGQVTQMSQQGYQPDAHALPLRMTSTEYNGPFGQVSQYDGPRTDISDIIQYSYYSTDESQGFNRGRLKRVKGPNNTVLRTNVIYRDNITYSSTGRVLSEDRPNGLHVSYSYYPGNDRLKTVTLSGDGKSISTFYDYLPTGEVKTIITNYGTTKAHTTTFTYDGARRLIQVEDDQGSSLQRTLDTEGNMLSEENRDSNGVLRRQITHVYNLNNQMESSTDGGITEYFNYSATTGQLLSKTTGAGVVTTFSYDALNQLRQQTDDNGSGDPATSDTTTGFEYDSQGNLTRVTDANGNQTHYTYDDFGNRLSVHSPDAGVTQYSYDEAGNPMQVVDARGTIINATYDALGRPEFVDYKGWVDDTRYVYDQGLNAEGRLGSYANGHVQMVFEYDPFGHMVRKSQRLPNVSGRIDLTASLEYQYNDQGLVEKIIYPSNLEVSYQYNSAGEIIRVDATTATGLSVVLAQNITYLPMGGPLVSMNLGNGLSYSAQYDTGYRLQSFQYGSVYGQSYSRDPVGNITQITSLNNEAPRYFTYDRLNRLRQETPGPQQYSYDRLGNRLSHINGHQATISYAYAADSNRLSSIDQFSRSYDSAGNTLTLDDQGLTASYDANGRLAAIQTASGVSAWYRYNPEGQRILKKRLDPPPAAPQYFDFLHGQDGHLLHYARHSGTHPGLDWRWETVWLGNRPLAQFRTDYSGASPVTELVYILTDHLNTPRQVTDKTGQVIWRWPVDAFGTGLPETDPDGDGLGFTFNLRFPGQYYDNETGLHYNYFRYYDPQTGRYITSDPIGLQGGLNTYPYANANPVRYVVTWSNGLVQPS